MLPNIKEIGNMCSFAILTDRKFYFIPGQKDDCIFSEEFEACSIGYYPFNFVLGTGWIFEKESIGRIKELFNEQKVPYVELLITEAQIHLNF